MHYLLLLIYLYRFNTHKEWELPFGLILAGAIGNMLGLWDEDTSWLLMGAMSALGAVWAGTKIDDPDWRFQYRWEDQPLTVPTE